MTRARSPAAAASHSAHTRGMIGRHTRKALAELKAQGVRLGRPSTVPKSVARLAARRRTAGKSLAAIAAELNAKGIATGQGGRRWYPSTVSKLLQRQD